jgi:hypothetical protein
MMEPVKPVKIWQPFVVLALFACGVIWLINTFNTSNPLWFWPRQPELRPSRILIYHYGTAMTLEPGMEGYEELTAVLNQSFAGFNNSALVNVGIGDETVARYYEEEFVLEITYPGTIQFNTPVRMDNVNQLLIPIDGRHSDQGFVFIGNNGFWLAGAMQLADLEPLRAELRRQGYEEDGMP